MKQGALVLVVLLVLVTAAACGPTNQKGLSRGQSASAFAVGANHVCAVVVDKTLRCFGDNSAGQLGDGSVVGPSDTGVSDAEVSDADAFSAPRIVPGLNNLAEITAGGAHTCARLDDGTVRCFGANDFGQLGDSTTIGRPTPVILPGLRDVRALSAGGAHTCAIRGDRTVACWGRNDDGQLGDGSTTMRPTPVAVTGLTEVEEIAAGTFHTCARLADGSVRCWGRNDAGQIGDGTVGTPRLSPTTVVGITSVRQIAVGLADSCALTPGHTLVCWGRGIERPSATPVIGFVDLQEIAVGASPTELHVCGRLGDRSIRCTTSLNETPRLIPGIVNGAKLAAGANAACALLEDGALRCWTSTTEPVSIVL